DGQRAVLADVHPALAAEVRKLPRQCLRGDAEQAGDVASRRIRGPETRLVASACVRHQVGGDLLAGTAVVETRTPDGIVAKSRAPGGQGPHRELCVVAENPQELRA